jgi:peptidyl-prolyl cis-trans isomerase NIMA-interacting 4
MTVSANSDLQCEKHSKKEEALAKLREGVKFDEVAREFSEDKARQGGQDW